MAVDSSQLVWDFLKTNSQAAALRAMIVDGADNVVEAGNITEDFLADAVSTRRADEELDKALGISVQDAGENPDPRIEGHFMQFVVVRVYDRGRGYRNIRTVRIELMALLSPKAFKENLGSGLGRGILTMSYNDRTGHQWDPAFAVEYEAVTFSFRVVKEG